MKQRQTNGFGPSQGNASASHATNGLSDEERVNLRASFHHQALRSGQLVVKRFDKFKDDTQALDAFRDHLWQAIEVNHQYTQNWQTIIDCALAGHPYMLRRGPWGRWGELLAMAIESVQQINDSWALAELHYNMGQLRHKQSHWQQAEQHLQRAGQLFTHLNDSVRPPRIWRLIAEQYCEQGERTKAESYAQRALDAQQVNGDRAGLAATYSTLGAIEFGRSDTDKALKWLTQALAIPELLDEPAIAARAHSNLGNLYSMLGNSPLAMKHYEDGCVIAEQISDYGVLNILVSNMGMQYASLGHLYKALDVLAQGSELAERCGDLMGVAFTSMQIGFVHSKLAKLETAQTYIQKYNRITKQLDATGHYAFGLIVLAENQLRLKEIEEANKSLAHAKRLSELVEYDPVSEGYYLHVKGQIDVEMGNWDAAAIKFRKSYAISADAQDYESAVESSRGMAQVEFSHGNLESAQEWLAKSYAASEEAARIDWFASTKDIEAKSALARGNASKAKALYSELCEILRQQPNDHTNLLLAKYQSALEAIVNG